MRTAYYLRCFAVYGRAAIVFTSEQARNDRADELAHQGHSVVTFARVL